MKNQAVELLPIDAVTPYQRNTRIHSEANIQKIAASIKEFGWTVPILVDEVGAILAGHGRLLAARALLMPEVPCLRLAGLSSAQKRAYRLADNRLTLDSDWDWEALKLELGELIDFDLALTGFDSDELDSILNAGLMEEGERQLSEAEADQLDGAWKLCINDWLRITDGALERGWISPNWTKGALAVLYLRALFFGEDINRSATLAYVPERMFVAGDKYDIASIFQRSLSGERSLRNSLLWSCKGRLNYEVIISWGLPVHGHRIPQDFPALLARDLVQEFCPPGGSVLDACHGWGGRLLGFLPKHSA